MVIDSEYIKLLVMGVPPSGPSKRKRPNEESSDSEGNLFSIYPSKRSETFPIPSESDVDVSLDDAALHTIWDVENAKEILQMISKDTGLTVFKAIRSQWGEGLEVKKAADKHIEGMYESGYADPRRGGYGILDMLEDTRALAEKLEQAQEYEGAFFFAHAVAEMIRRCEDDEDEDDKEKVVEWAKALDTVMAGAVKGWRAQSGKGKKGKQDAATMVELLDKGKGAKGCDQKKWYPETYKVLRSWAK